MNNNDHDYEPGTERHPMSSEPNCRICGETRRTCEGERESAMRSQNEIEVMHTRFDALMENLTAEGEGILTALEWVLNICGDDSLTAELPTTVTINLPEQKD